MYVDREMYLTLVWLVHLDVLLFIGAFIVLGILEFTLKVEEVQILGPYSL